MGTNSMIRSILSTTRMFRGDLYASVKTLFRYWTLAISLKPIMFSADTSLIKGKSELCEMAAARAVFPDPGGPWSSTESSDVVGELRTWLTKDFPSLRICSMYGL
jgi:hypothetical protein